MDEHPPSNSPPPDNADRQRTAAQDLLLAQFPAVTWTVDQGHAA